MKTVDFSLIIPCYNNASTLDSFSSMLNEIKYNSFEVIFVDDGSTDNTLEKLNSLSKNSKYPVQILKQKNSGPGVARNKGLKSATGKYIWFIDSDDFFDTDSFSLFFEILKNTNADVLAFDYKTVRNQNEIFFSNTNDFSVENNRKSIIFEPSCPWSKIYKRTFLIDNNIKFPPYYFAEDLVFNIRVWVKAEKIIHLNRITYNYYLRDDSVSNTWQTKHISEFLEIIKLLYKESEINRNYCEEICYAASRHTESFLNNINIAENQNEIQKLTNFISENKIENNTYNLIRNEIINKYEHSFRWKITEPFSKLKKWFRK